MEDSGSKKKKTAVTTTQSEESPLAQENLKEMNLEDLQTLLNDVLEQEDYIRAIAIRDEINSRGRR
jgi:protein-arginine kinase activator protein McsA